MLVCIPNGVVIEKHTHIQPIGKTEPLPWSAENYNLSLFCKTWVTLSITLLHLMFWSKLFASLITTKSSRAKSHRRLYRYRVDVVVILSEWFVVLYDRSEVWKSRSDFEYLLQLFVGIHNDHVTLGTVGHVPAGVRRVCRVNTGRQTAGHSLATINIHNK